MSRMILLLFGFSSIRRHVHLLGFDVSSFKLAIAFVHSLWMFDLWVDSASAVAQLVI
jgi:hypothetical protein